jgi:tripartite-type tricarboxylate transporter receptor subunit TctC
MYGLLSTKLRICASAAMVAATFATAPAGADPVADFYRGKVVTVYVGYSVGGGYDLYARALA